MTTPDTGVAAAAARAGADVALASWRTPVARHAKGGIDVATGHADRTWLVDPICGTLNYAAGTPLFAVNVALRENGRVRVAAVADPATGEVFVTDGERAWRD